jgi:hypothetical protein
MQYFCVPCRFPIIVVCRLCLRLGTADADYQELSYVGLQTLQASTTRAAVLADYRKLWLQLSHLTTQTGVAFCYTYSFYLLHQFFMLTLSTYATLSDIIVGTFGNNILVTACVLITGFMICIVCEGANGVVFKVSSQIVCHHVRDLRCSWEWRATMWSSGSRRSVVQYLIDDA